MNYYDILLAKKLNGGGGGGDVDVISLSVSANGKYTAPSGKAYSPVNVSVPQGVVPSGTYNITQNGIYDVTNFASASVNVSGGGGEDLLELTMKRNISAVLNYSFSGAVRSYFFQSCDELAGVSFSNCTSVYTNAFQSCTSLSFAYFPSCVQLGSSAFYGCTSLKEAHFPIAKSTNAGVFSNCTALTEMNFLSLSILGSSTFRNCRSLSKVYLHSTSVVRCDGSVFYSTPMADSSYLGYFGSIYVPASLVSSYQSATNWTSISSRITAIV